jgi:hypothetical protein
MKSQAEIVFEIQQAIELERKLTERGDVSLEPPREPATGSKVVPFIITGTPPPPPDEPGEKPAASLGPVVSAEPPKPAESPKPVMPAPITRTIPSSPEPAPAKPSEPEEKRAQQPQPDPAPSYVQPLPQQTETDTGVESSEESGPPELPETGPNGEEPPEPNHPAEQPKAMNSNQRQGYRQKRGRTPATTPFSDDAERGLISCLLQAPGRIFPEVDRRWFFTPAYIILYDTISAWDDPAQRVDFVWLIDQLEAQHQLQEAGGREYISALYDFVPSPDPFPNYINSVKDCFCRREGMRVSIRLTELLVDRAEDPQELLKGAIKELERVNDGNNELRLFRGASILDYAGREIDMSQSVLGNRWLSRQRGAFVIAPSGHGKSSFTIQATICWACGRVAFGIKPNTLPRILIIQSEDDDNDVIEMAQMCQRLNLSDNEKELVRRNTHVELVDDVTGDGFFRALDVYLKQFPCDLVIINPYTAYQGGALVDDERNNQFLRVNLQALLNRHNCAALIIHHTPKTNYQNVDTYSWYDWMYTMAGGAALTNWARAILVIAPSKTPGTYRFIAAKRFDKIEWQSREYWYSHSVENDVMLWVPSKEEQILAAGKNKKAGPEEVLSQIPEREPISQEKLYAVMNKPPFNMGIESIKRSVRLFLTEGEIFKHLIARDGIKSAVGYSKTPPIDPANEDEEECKCQSHCPTSKTPANQPQEPIAENVNG